ncbi:flagellar protein FlaF [Rubricella aquisinus]|uniref:Flagellar protein FlaF n=1 Tax=Rubricella aquisinus TaxID=2028108 RepID=A0A840WXX3_9RHOB|nr:flagellar biosynthesis regulator FlaF [Rubricella aquisinus]MBB5515224.1 flagellar protein FlaF [Rubricella aquisinus]
MYANPYSDPTPHQNPRDVEYSAFARITAALKASKDGPFAAIAEALHANRRLWDIIAGDVSQPENGLPKPLRAQLFYLSEFSRVHGAKVLKGEATVDALIDVNTAVMRGLRAAQPAMDRDVA